MKDKLTTRIAVILMTLVVAFTALPIVSGDIDAHAATPKKPARTIGLKAGTVTKNSITIKWSKVKTKGVKGYQVYRYNAGKKKWQRIKTLKALNYKNTGLKANTSYKYKVRAYTSYKQKQYYNSKTKKWQVKKPATKNWKGRKTRNVTKYLYGAFSTTKTIKTKKTVKTTTSSSSTSTSTDNKFANSKLSNKTLYIDKTNTYIDCLYTISTSKDERDAVKWTSSNTSVATVEKDAFNGSASLIVVKAKGTTTITATNWDGQKKTATVTVKEYIQPSNPQNPQPGTTQQSSNITCTEARVMNQYPIYDFSYPSFEGIPEESVKKQLDFYHEINKNLVFLYFKPSESIDREQLTFYNKTVGAQIRDSRYGGPGFYGHCDIRGYTASYLADVDYKDYKTGELKRGGYLINLNLQSYNVRQGNNTIEIRYNDAPIGTVVVNVKSRASAYYNYVKTVAQNSTPFKYEWDEITKNVTLWKQLMGMKQYIQASNKYTECVYANGNLVVESLKNHGTYIIDNGLGGCEDGAIVMSLCCMYMGVDATYKYEYGHCVCTVINGEEVFGDSNAGFDATPNKGTYFKMTQDEYLDYINSLPIII